RLAYLRPEAFGKTAARDGTVSVHLTIEPETIGQRPMFAVRLHAISDRNEQPDASIDADLELDLLLQRVQLLEALMQEDKTRGEEHELASRRARKNLQRRDMESKLARIDEDIERLTRRRQRLAGKIDRVVQDVEEISARHDEIKSQQEERSEVLTRVR